MAAPRRKKIMPIPGSIGAELLKEVSPSPPPEPTVLARVPLGFKLLGKHWRVTLKQMEDYGHCEVQHLHILLSNTQPVGHLRDTYLHETLHAIDLETELGMTEKQVHVMATIFLAWMRDNPKVVAWLMEEGN